MDYMLSWFVLFKEGKCVGERKASIHSARRGQIKIRRG
jgi:hypothetical protein